MRVDIQLDINGLKELKPYLQSIMLIENYEGMGENDAKEVGKTFALAIEALEKQIPKKPISSESFVTGRLCPICEKRLSIGYMKFCSDCGQALDWSGT